jgi:hypothetical protein
MLNNSDPAPDAVAYVVVERRDELLINKVTLDLVPKNRNVGLHLRVVHDVMEGDNPIYERGVEFKVLLHTLVGVVAINEEEVDSPTIEQPFKALSGLTRLRIAKPSMYFLLVSRIPLQLGRTTHTVSIGAKHTLIVATGEVDGHQEGVRCCDPTPSPEGATLGSTDLDYDFGLSTLYETE